MERVQLSKDIIEEMRLSKEDKSILSINEIIRVKQIGALFTNNEYFENYCKKIVKFFVDDKSEEALKVAYKILEERKKKEEEERKKKEEEERKEKEKEDSKTGINVTNFFSKVKSFYKKSKRIIQHIKDAMDLVKVVHEYITTGKLDIETILLRMGRALVSMGADYLENVDLTPDAPTARETKRNYKIIRLVKGIFSKIFSILAFIGKGLFNLIKRIFCNGSKGKGKGLIFKMFSAASRILSKMREALSSFLNKLFSLISKTLGRAAEAVGVGASKRAGFKAAGKGVLKAILKKFWLVDLIWTTIDLCIVIRDFALAYTNMKDNLGNKIWDYTDILVNTIRNIDFHLDDIEDFFNKDRNIDKIFETNLKTPKEPSDNIDKFIAKRNKTDKSDSLSYEDEKYPKPPDEKENEQSIYLKGRGDFNSAILHQFSQYSKQSSFSQYVNDNSGYKLKINNSKVPHKKSKKVQITNKDLETLQRLGSLDRDNINRLMDNNISDDILGELLEAIRNEDDFTINRIYNSNLSDMEANDKNLRELNLGTSDEIFKNLDELFELFLMTYDAFKLIFFGTLNSLTNRLEEFIKYIKNIDENFIKIYDIENFYEKTDAWNSTSKEDEENLYDITISGNTLMDENGKPIKVGDKLVEIDISSQKKLFNIRLLKKELISTNKQLFEKCFNSNTAILLY